MSAANKTATDTLRARRRGHGVWPFDADGNRYLDACNDLPCVGHVHPRVVEAVSRQAALLNTTPAISAR